MEEFASGAGEVSGDDLAARFLGLDAAARGKLLDALTPEELLQLEGDIDLRVRSNFGDWCRLALSEVGQAPARHHRLLIRELEDIANGENDRLMVLMPPGAAKSTYVSDLFPPWFLSRLPNQSVIGASHTSGLAQYFSRRAQKRIEVHGDTLGVRLVGEAVESWSTSNGGEYKAVGVGGAIAGRRADLEIIDDPIKSREEADNQIVRNRAWDWYIGDMIGRLKPTGRVVLVMTRWHHDDPAGRLLEHERGRWRVVSMPALAEADDLLGRAEGEALWPEWESREKLLDKQTTLGGEESRDWLSQFQQRPSSESGTLFNVGQIAILDEMPPVVRRVRAWDLAATEAGAVQGRGRAADPDWTVGVLLAKTTMGRWVIEDVVRFRGRPEVVEQRMLETAASDGSRVSIGLPQDPGQAGKSQISYLTAKLAGYRVISTTESGSKATRAMPVISQCNGGNLSMLRAPWNMAMTNELRQFPAGRNDDQVDALSRAFGMLVVAARPTRPGNVLHMAR